MSSNLVTKHNELIESSYRLTLTEARIIFYGLSLVNPTAKDFNYQFRIDIKAFAKMFGLENSKDLYGQLKTAAMDKFWLREFTFPTTNDRKLRVGWLSGIEYGDKEGYLKIFINPQLQPFLHQMHNNFTSYHLENISKFKSIYSVRFYEIALMQLKKSPRATVSFKILISEIKETLEIVEKYSRFSNLKAFVLEPARKEINRHSDIKFSYGVIKQGRTPYEIKFAVSYRGKRKEDQLPLLDESEINLSPSIIEKAKTILTKRNSRLDIYDIVEQFKTYAQKNGTPNNINGAFIGFVKKKIAKTE